MKELYSSPVSDVQEFSTVDVISTSIEFMDDMD